VSTGSGSWLRRLSTWRDAPVRTDRLSWRLDPAGLLLLAPAGAILLLLSVGPVVYAVYLGLTNADLTGPTATHFSFTPGADLSALVHDSLFWKALWLTGLFVGASAILGVTVVGMVLAVLMQRAARWLRALVGSVVVAAWILPAVTSATLWFALTTQGGTLSALFTGGRGDPLDAQPMLMIVLANIWTTAGFAMLVLAGGLRNVPSEALEAAALEGASHWRIFRSVTLPLMRSSIVTTVLLVSLFSLANFSLLYTLTGGGPGNATDILPIYSYQEAFEFNRLAYGALLGDVVVVVGSILAYIYVRFSSRHAASMIAGG
jgi:multiple sugar transport system permease protein